MSAEGLDKLLKAEQEASQEMITKEHNAARLARAVQAIRDGRDGLGSNFTFVLPVSSFAMTNSYNMRKELLERARSEIAQLVSLFDAAADKLWEDEDKAKELARIEARAAKTEVVTPK